MLMLIPTWVLMFLVSKEVSMTLDIPEVGEEIESFLKGSNTTEKESDSGSAAALRSLVG
jgi:hypothetical protein